MSKINFKKQKGFALLFSVLVSTLIISIGATIVSISIRQTILSGTARESQIAFYAANTALECAFFWDTKRFDPAVTTGVVFPVGNETFVSTPDVLNCAGGNIQTSTGYTHSFSNSSWQQTGVGGNSSSTTFRMTVEDKATSGTDDLDNTPITCAAVTVRKTLNTEGIVTTEIEAKGYNTCDINNPRAIERGLELQYQN